MFFLEPSYNPFNKYYNNILIILKLHWHSTISNQKEEAWETSKNKRV